MNNTLFYIVVNCCFAALLWLGFIEGIDGAQNAVKFLVWAFFLPLSFLMFSESVQKRLAERCRTSKVTEMAHGLVNFFAIFVLVWNGHFVTAAAFLFHMFALAVCREGENRCRAKRSSD